MPSQPSHWASSRPVHSDESTAQSRLALPCASPLRQRSLQRRGHGLGQFIRQAIDLSGPCASALLLHRLEQLVEGVRKKLQPLGEKFLRDFLHRNSELL